MSAAGGSGPRVHSVASFASRLHPDDVEAIARRVAELVATAQAEVVPRRLVDAGELGVRRECVYTNAAELGGRRVGSGRRARWRFDVERALSAWTSRGAGEGSQVADSPVPSAGSRRRQGRRSVSSTPLLPIHGQEGP